MIQCTNRAKKMNPEIQGGTELTKVKFTPKSSFRPKAPLEPVRDWSKRVLFKNFNHAIPNIKLRSEMQIVIRVELGLKNLTG